METQFTTGSSAAVPTPGPVVRSRAPGGAAGGSEFKNLQAVMNQFRTAAQLMTTQITRMSIEAYGASAALQTLNGSLLGLNAATVQAAGSTAAFDASLVGLRGSTNTTQAAVTSLDQTLQNMQGVTVLAESLGRMNQGAIQVQATIDGALLPATDRAYTAFFDLADAAIGFHRTVGQVVSQVSADLASVPRPGTGSGAGAGTGAGTGAGENGASNPWFTPVTPQHPVRDIFNNTKKGATDAAGAVGSLARGAGAWAPWITGGAAVIGGGKAYLDTREAQQEAQRRANYRFMPLPDLLTKRRETETELRRRWMAEVERDRTLHAYQNQPGRNAYVDGQEWVDNGKRLFQEMDTARQRVWWSQESTQGLQFDYQAMEEALSFQQGMATQRPYIPYSDRELERMYPGTPAPATTGTGAGTGVGTAGTGAGTVTGSGNPAAAGAGRAVHSQMPTSRRPVPARAPDILTEQLKQAGYLAGIHNDARRRGEPFAEGTAASQNFERIFDLFTEVQGRLEAGGLDPRAEGLLRDIRRTLADAVPSLAQPVVPVVVVPDNSAAETAFLAQFQQGPGPAAPAAPPAATGLAAMFNSFRSTASALYSQASAGAGSAWGQAKEMGAQQVASVGQGFVGLLSSFTPLGMVATLLQGVFEGLAPLVEALKEPLRIVGAILGAALAPILEAMFPVFKLLAIATTYVGEFLFRLAAVLLKVSAAIWTGIGTFIAGIGKLINKLLPGNPAKGLVKLGEGMVKTGKTMNRVADGFEKGADALKKGRKQIEEMEWGETAEAARDLSESLQNVPDGFRVALARLEAMAPETVGGGGGGGEEEDPPLFPPPPHTGPGRYPGDQQELYSQSYGGAAPVTIQQVQIVSNDPEAVWREMRRIIERENARGYGSPLSPVPV